MPFDFGIDHEESLQWQYQNTFTIDPGEADEAWEKLNINQWTTEFSHLPKLLHFALIETIKERKPFGRIRG